MSSFIPHNSLDSCKYYYYLILILQMRKLKHREVRLSNLPTIIQQCAAAEFQPKQSSPRICGFIVCIILQESLYANPSEILIFPTGSTVFSLLYCFVLLFT